MRVSELILPIRMYNSLFSQNRFNINCPDDKCGLQLVYPKNGLPMFQFTRPASLNTPTHLYLKNTCDDYFIFHDQILSRFQKQIPEPANIFMSPVAESFYTNYPPKVDISDVGPSPTITNVDFTEWFCGALQIKEVPPGYIYDPAGGHPLVPHFDFTIDNNEGEFILKIVVEKFSSASGVIQIMNDTNELIQISGSGTYEIKFISISNDMRVNFSGFLTGDDFSISYLQVQDNDYTILGANSIVLDETKLKVMPTGATDIITYCGDVQNYNPKYGTYYYIVITGTETYFSEVFEIKSLLELQTYYKLKWYHSCNINPGVIYNPGDLDCTFYNILYLEGGLFNPEYDTQETDQQNGYGDKLPTQKRWQKSITMDVLKSPGFLTDALSGVFIHDNIYLKEPINNYQDIDNDFIQVQSTTTESEDIADNCYQYVKMKIILEDRFTGDNCCVSASVITCPYTVQYTGTNSCGSYQIIISDPPAIGDGLKNCASGELVPLKETDIVFNSDDGFYYSFTLVSGIYVTTKMPSITVVNDDGIFYYIHGKALPYTFAVLFYSIDSGIAIEYSKYVQSDKFGNYILTLPFDIISEATTLDIEVELRSFGCIIKRSSTFNVF